MFINILPKKCIYMDRTTTEYKYYITIYQSDHCIIYRSVFSNYLALNYIHCSINN